MKAIVGHGTGDIRIDDVPEPDRTAGWRDRSEQTGAIEAYKAFNAAEAICRLARVPL